MNLPKPIYTLILAFTLLSTNAFALGENVSPEASEATLLASAKEKLDAESDTVILYARGLCCPSCAIGVRKMISKLDFVDRQRFNKGVELDTKTQLVTVAISSGIQADFDSLAKAINKAGYDPEKAYFLENSAFATRSIALAAKN
jgi:copper chaperone CopZ